MLAVVVGQVKREMRVAQHHLVAVQGATHRLTEQQEQPTLAVEVEVAMEVVQEVAAQVAQASSSFHTQAQHNYLVVELLPNQAVTLFTHSHLLAHLALCHL
jgi:hypothetical protein